MTESHPFQHIMPGPYRYAGYRDAQTIADKISLKDSSEISAFLVKPEEGQCIGSCDHCNTAICYAVLIEGANGVFKVGETCAKKIDKYEPTIAKKAREDGNLRRLTRKNAATESAFDEAVDRLESDSSFKAQPHPKGWPGKTLHDYLAWYKDNAGKAKFVQIFKLATK